MNSLILIYDPACPTQLLFEVLKLFSDLAGSTLARSSFTELPEDRDHNMVWDVKFGG
jgi:hypothetical protein